jgi:hypothetical protein
MNLYYLRMRVQRRVVGGADIRAGAGMFSRGCVFITAGDHLLETPPPIPPPRTFRLNGARVTDWYWGYARTADL